MRARRHAREASAESKSARLDGANSDSLAGHLDRLSSAQLVGNPLGRHRLELFEERVGQIGGLLLGHPCARPPPDRPVVAEEVDGVATVDDLIVAVARRPRGRAPRPPCARFGEVAASTRPVPAAPNDRVPHQPRWSTSPEPSHEQHGPNDPRESSGAWGQLIVGCHPQGNLVVPRPCGLTGGSPVGPSPAMCVQAPRTGCVRSRGSQDVRRSSLGELRTRQLVEGSSGSIGRSTSRALPFASRSERRAFWCRFARGDCAGGVLRTMCTPLVDGRTAQIPQ